MFCNQFSLLFQVTLNWERGKYAFWEGNIVDISCWSVIWICGNRFCLRWYCTGVFSTVGMQNCPPPKGWIFLGFWDSSNALKAKQAFGFVKSETAGAVPDWWLPVPAKCLPLIANFPMRLCANKCPWINKSVNSPGLPVQSVTSYQEHCQYCILKYRYLFYGWVQ